MLHRTKHPLLALDIVNMNEPNETSMKTVFLKVERASFTPLVFNTSGGASPLTTTFLKHLASLLAEKRDLMYSTVLGWLRAQLNFSLLRAAITCICGSCSKVGHACHENTPDLAVSETELSLH